MGQSPFGKSPSPVTSALNHWAGFKRVPADLMAWLSRSLGRRRLLISVSGLLVCAYAGSVLWYVMSLPEIGIRFSLTRDIYHVDDSYLHPEIRESAQQLLPEDKDQVLELGDQEVSTWVELLRKVSSLRTEHSPVCFD